MKLDVFNHIFPKTYFDRMLEVLPDGKDSHKRVRDVPCMWDLDERVRIMDKVPGYAQIICLGAPPVEYFGPPSISDGMTSLANDGMADLVRKYPERFPGFIASLPMNGPEGLLKDAERAVKQLGAVGVQVFSNVLGRPLTDPATECSLKFYGADKVLFASDMPFDPEKGTAYIRWTIDIIDRLPISAAERYKIYEGNARSLLKLQ